MMANAARDPLFWAALDVANHDGGQNGLEGIGDYCLRCHSPKGWHGGRVRKTQDVTPVNGQVDASLVVNGFNGCLLQGDYDNSDGPSNDYGGVGCHFCHRQQQYGPNGEAPLLGSGDIWLDDTDCTASGYPGPCRAGPYNDYPVVTSNGEITPPHSWKFSPYHSGSGICGSCHDVTTPILENGPARTLIAANGTMGGNDTGIAFPIERTYSEWSRSDYAAVLFNDGMEDGGAAMPGQRLVSGQTCQNCHMRQAVPQTPGAPLYVVEGTVPRNGNLPVHEFAGGNTWIPNILKGEFPNLNRGADFDRTIGWANEMLSQRSALVDTGATLSANGTSLTATVKVTNLAGHKLPTGYPEGRRMWLTIEVRDANDSIIWSNGGWNAATGELSVDGQTKIYEVKQGIWDAAAGECRVADNQGRDQFHFVLNNCIAKDNRIPPLGFTAAADPELAPYGYSYPAIAPGSARTVNYDTTQYNIPLPANPAFPLQVKATLRYQTASKEYIQFLRDQAVENAFPVENTLCAGGPNRPFAVGPQNKSRGQYAYDLWNSAAYGRSPPVAMGSDEITITF